MASQDGSTLAAADDLAKELAGGQGIIKLGESLMGKLEELEAICFSEIGKQVSYQQALQLETILLVTLAKVRRVSNLTRPGGLTRLPDPLLVKVFEFAPKSCRQTISLTHVCWRWRTLALSSPSLWTHISFDPRMDMAMAQAFLDRSSSEPLTLVFSGSPEVPLHRPPLYALSLQRTLEAASNRIRSIIIKPGFDSILAADSKLLGGQMTDNVHPRSLLGFFINTELPKIQQLQLLYATIPLFLRRPRPFETLSVLEMVHFDKKKRLDTGLDKPHLALSKLLNVLSAPRATLKMVVLIGVPFWNDAVAITEEPIALNALDSLELGNWQDGDVISIFSRSRRLTPSCRRCLWGRIVQELPPQVFWSLSPPITVMRVVLGSVPGPSMLAFASGALYINGTLPFPTIHSLLEAKHSGEPLASVEELVLTPLVYPFRSTEWTTLFELLPNIRRVDVRDADPGALLYALTISPSHLAHLTEIHIRFRYVAPREAPDRCKFDPLNNAYTTELHSVVSLLSLITSQRALVNTPLKEVYLRLGVRNYSLPSKYLMHRAFDVMCEKYGAQKAVLVSNAGATWASTMYVWGSDLKELHDEWYHSKREFDGVWPADIAQFAHGVETYL